MSLLLSKYNIVNKMRLAILSKEGIEAIVDEILEALPLNRRFQRANRRAHEGTPNHEWAKYRVGREELPYGFMSAEEIPYDIKVIPAHGSYSRDDKSSSGNYEERRLAEETRLARYPIDLVVYPGVPNFAIASTEDEKRKIGSESYYKQNQLIVLDNCVFFRNLKLGSLARHKYKIDVTNIEGIYLDCGHCLFEKESWQGFEQKDPNGIYTDTRDKDSAHVRSDTIWRYKTPRIWGHIVEEMINYFLSNQKYMFSADSHKVVVGSERSKNKVTEIFEKLGLKAIEKNETAISLS